MPSALWASKRSRRRSSSSSETVKFDPETRTKEDTLDTEALARHVADLALERKAEDVIVLDLRHSSSYADFLVVASGTSDRHVQAVSEFVENELKRGGVSLIGAEGLREGQWALVDCGSVVLHVFHHYTRQVYDLETLWEQAPRLRLAMSRGGVSQAQR